MTLTESIPTTVLALLLAVAVLGASPAAAAQFDTTAQSDNQLEMSVEQDGDTITLTLTSSADDVAGVETNISFDPSVVEFVEAEGVDLPDPVTNSDNDKGWVFITQAQGGGGVDQPTLTKLTFEVVSDGSSDFDYDETETGLFDSEGMEIPVEVSGTSVDVSGDDTDGSSDDGSSDDGSSDGTNDDSSDQESGSSEGGDDGQMNDEDNSDSSDGEDTNSDSESGDSSDADTDSDDSGEAPDSDSSLISGIGLLAVVAGFLFAVAILARNRM